MSRQVLATFREAAAKLRHEAGGALSEDDVLLLMARQVLAGPSDAGQSSYQIAITVCEHCGRGHQQGSGELVEVSQEMVETARCDGQQIGSLSRPVQQSSSSTDASPTHMGRSAEPPHRASQSIPPSIRREVMRRDAGCCVVPGCRHSLYVDLHHLKPRAEGGRHDPDQLVVLCAAHHRALHLGHLQTEGTVSSGLVFRHADGTPYGKVESPSAAEAYQKAFVALRGLGFRETDARQSLDRVRRETGATDVESVLRRGLALLAA